MSFPCTVALSRYSDLLVLERTIRELLRCQSPTCAFLQSAEYKRLKFTITRALSQPGAPPDEDAEKVLHIPHSQLVMYVSDDCTTVLIQSKASVYLEVAAPPVVSKRKNGEAVKRRKMAADDYTVGANESDGLDTT